MKTLGLGAFAIIVAAATQLHANIILPNLPAGSEYQLVFVTSDARNASSTNIADYNSFVTSEAAQDSSLPATTWKVVASTAAVNATNNSITYASIPIYNTHGQLVASGSGSFWYPTHTNLIDYDEYGLSNSQYVWTGTNANGTTNNPLGPANSTLGFSTDTTASHWTFFTQGGTSGAEEFYAMSAPITVDPSPEPSTLALLGVGLVSLVAVRWRRRKHGVRRSIIHSHP